MCCLNNQNYMGAELELFRNKLPKGFYSLSRFWIMCHLEIFKYYVHPNNTKNEVYEVKL
jgi:hypothetical protein